MLSLPGIWMRWLGGLGLAIVAGGRLLLGAVPMVVVVAAVAVVPMVEVV